MAVTGAHVLLYTPDPDAVRAVLRDAFGFRHVDAGEGWLIFALPPAEVAVHPADGPRHELTFMCDDLEATVADLASKGVDVRPERQTAGWGVQATMVLPGGVEVMLYQPRHSTAT
jgi:catechol 2,3-dioxygenase-like lactoylglutathione lyase family enzyme